MTTGLLKLALIGLACMALSSEQQNWTKWRKEHYQKALESPTSFLNAYQLKQAQKGHSLYLVEKTSRQQSYWTAEKPKGTITAQAQHLGNKIRIQIQGRTYSYLSLEKGKRRQKWTLDNGAIAEVVFGKRVQKLWTYLYDPDQIKKFTGFQFYDFNPKAITQGYVKLQKPEVISYKTVQGDQTEVKKVGNISFSIQGQAFYLPAYNWQPQGEPLKYLAVIFVDQSAGRQTYGGGRELVIETPNGVTDGMAITMDFNRTVNFYCAHSPFWHCPVGLQKKIAVNLQAGEKLPLKKVVTK